MFEIVIDEQANAFFLNVPQSCKKRMCNNAR